MDANTTEHVAADNLTLWGYVVDATLWSDWIDGVERVSPVGHHGPARSGGQFEVKATWLPATTVTIGDVDADEGLEFHWEGEGAGSFTVHVEEVSHGASVLRLSISMDDAAAGDTDLEKLLIVSAGRLRQRGENSMLDPVH